MTAPVPEERNDAYDLKEGDEPPGEHDSDLPGEADGASAASSQQRENAETSLDQPSQ